MAFLAHRDRRLTGLEICASSEDLWNWPGVAHKRWSASAANGRPIRLAVDEWLQHAARGSETRHLEVRFFRGDSNRLRLISRSGGLLATRRCQPASWGAFWPRYNLDRSPPPVTQAILPTCC